MREREEEGGSCVAGCDNLAAIFESMYGKSPMHKTACEEAIGFPGDVFVGGSDGHYSRSTCCWGGGGGLRRPREER